MLGGFDPGPLTFEAVVLTTPTALLSHFQNIWVTRLVVEHSVSTFCSGFLGVPSYDAPPPSFTLFLTSDDGG